MTASLYEPRYQALRTAMVAARKAAGLTQVQMAEKLQVGQSFVSKIERGQNYVDVLLFLDWFQICNQDPRRVLDAVQGV